MLYVLFALLLTYVYAPIRGAVGQIWMAKVLSYADERSLGTAIYDVKGRFVGIFDPILDSEEDFNYTGRPIELPDFIAYPDHKSLHVGDGLKPGVEMGPLVTADHRKKVVGYIEKGVAEGAQPLCDGRAAAKDSKGFFVGPTIFDHVTPQMTIPTVVTFRI